MSRKTHGTNRPKKRVERWFSVKKASIARAVANVLSPSSSHACSNSLLPTTPYQNWWPASWTVTSSGLETSPGASQRVPAVKKVGYSIPPERLCQAGSTIVTCSYGYGPNHSP